MDRQTTIKRSIHLTFQQAENKALQDYLDQNGIKLQPLIRILILKELEEKKAINLPDFAIPKITDCLIKSRR